MVETIAVHFKIFPSVVKLEYIVIISQYIYIEREREVTYNVMWSVYLIKSLFNTSLGNPYKVDLSTDKVLEKTVYNL